MGEVQRRLGSEDMAVRFWAGGEWEAIAALLETAVQASERADDRISHLRHGQSLGEIYRILGEHVRAEANLQYGLDNGDRC